MADKYLNESGLTRLWNKIRSAFFAKAGGEITGDTTLKADAGQSSPTLVFQRGTLTDNYNDWRLQDRGGYLYFDERGSGSTDWTNRVMFNTTGTVTATSFSGSGSSLTSLNASNISSGTIDSARLPSPIPTKTSDITNDGSDGTSTYLEADETAYRTAGIPYGECDDSSTATAFTATVPGITELRDGVCMLLKNGAVTSAEGFTININGLGAKPSYSNLAAATRDTTIFNVNYTMLFVYDSTRVSGGAWICYRGYDSNTNTIGYQLRTNSMTMPVTGACYRYRLLFTSADGKHYVPANTSSSTNATASRTVNQTPINPFGDIRYYGSTTALSSGGSPGTGSLWQQYAVTLGYSFNRTGAALTLTSKAPVYIKCAPQADGSAIMDSTNPYTQALPSTADGNIYIFLGIAYSATAIELLPYHPVYYYDGGIRLWTNAPSVSVPTKTSDLTNDSGYIGIDTLNTIMSNTLSSPFYVSCDKTTTLRIIDTYTSASPATISKTFEYSTDRTNWTHITLADFASTGIPLTANQKVYIVSNDSVPFYTSSHSVGFDVDYVGAQLTIGGEVKTLFNYAAILPAHALHNLFLNNTKIHSASSLIIPDVSAYSCANMFASSTVKYCSSMKLEGAVSDYSYDGMFMNSSLVYAPKIINGGSGNYCCRDMFNGCSSLMTNPSNGIMLSTEVLIGPGCYQRMFAGCTRLSAIPPIISASKITATDAMTSMFEGCTSLTTAPSLASLTSVASYSCDSMFKGCSSLNSIPGLYIDTFNNYSLRKFLMDCTSLKFSATQTTECPNAYRLPMSGTATPSGTPFVSMFSGTSGTYTSDPVINTTYYTNATVV